MPEAARVCAPPLGPEARGAPAFRVACGVRFGALRHLSWPVAPRARVSDFLAPRGSGAFAFFGHRT
eukprot:7577599-Lingulodinium_polyedra.AAC.1